MAQPLITVLMPVRDMAATVEGAVRSVLPELGPADQAVLVDDRSTDGTRAILEALAAGDPRILLVDGPGEGVAAALNAGLARCEGRFIARMDADDVSLPGRIAACVAALQRDERLAAVGTRIEVFRDDQPVSPNMQAYAAWLGSLTSFEALYADRFVESPLCHPSAVLRATALREAGGYASGPWPEDYALWLELLQRGWRLTNIGQVLLRWRDHSARATRQDPRYAQRRHLELKARYLAVLPTLGARGCGLLGAGKTGLGLSRALAAHGVRTAFFVDVSPKKVGGRLEGAPVLGHEALRGPDGVHLIAAVGSKGGRAELRALLAARGYREGADFTCAA